MDTMEARNRISTGEFDRCVVLPGILAGEGLNVTFWRNDDPTYLYRARGVRAEYRSFDAAISAARLAGWKQKIVVAPEDYFLQ